MSDPFLTEFWRQAPSPWNELGPQIAENIRSDAPIAARSGFPPGVPEAKLTRWARQLREARRSRAMRRSEVARAIGVDPHSIWAVEMDQAGPNASTWAKLAAFYGVRLE